MCTISLARKVLEISITSVFLTKNYLTVIVKRITILAWTVTYVALLKLLWVTDKWQMTTGDCKRATGNYRRVTDGYRPSHRRVKDQSKTNHRQLQNSHRQLKAYHGWLRLGQRRVTDKSQMTTDSYRRLQTNHRQLQISQGRQSYEYKFLMQGLRLSK